MLYTHTRHSYHVITCVYVYTVDIHTHKYTTQASFLQCNSLCCVLRWVHKHRYTHASFIYNHLCCVYTHTQVHKHASFVYVINCCVHRHASFICNNCVVNTGTHIHSLYNVITCVVQTHKLHFYNVIPVLWDLSAQIIQTIEQLQILKLQKCVPSVNDATL